MTRVKEKMEEDQLLPSKTMGMETVVVVAIATLALVFIGSLLALLAICYHRYLKRRTLFKHLTDSVPDVNLINGVHGVELDEVQIHPEIDKILADARWVDDATGLIPHCLAILKSCHHFTERLVGATMSLLPRYEEGDQQKKLWDIIRVAQRISPRVDDVVQSMYPPLDPRLLEARCLSLVLSVVQLALVIRYSINPSISWIESSVTELEDSWKVLREAGKVHLESSTGNSTPESGVVNPACTGTESESNPPPTV